MGPTAKALGPLANGYAQHEGTSILETVPADRHHCRHGEENEDFGTSPFFRQLFRQACLPVYVKMGAPGIKNNRSHPLFCRGRHVADLVDRDSVRPAGGSCI